MCEHETTRIERGIVEFFDIEEVGISCNEVCEICGEIIDTPTLVYHRDY